MGQIKAAIRGKTDAAREIADRVEGKVPRPLEISDVWYSLEIDASELPAGVTVVREQLPDGLPAAVEGHRSSCEEPSEQRDASDTETAASS